MGVEVVSGTAERALRDRFSTRADGPSKQQRRVGATIRYLRGCAGVEIVSNLTISAKTQQEWVFIVYIGGDTIPERGKHVVCC